MKVSELYLWLGGRSLRPPSSMSVNQASTRLLSPIKNFVNVIHSSRSWRSAKNEKRESLLVVALEKALSIFSSLCGREAMGPRCLSVAVT